MGGDQAEDCPAALVKSLPLEVCRDKTLASKLLPTLLVKVRLIHSTHMLTLQVALDETYHIIRDDRCFV
jgi:hypothetical protein